MRGHHPTLFILFLNPRDPLEAIPLRPYLTNLVKTTTLYTVGHTYFPVSLTRATLPGYARRSSRVRC